MRSWTGELETGLYQAGQKDAQKLAAAGLKPKQKSCSTFWPRIPSKTLPLTKKLVGDLAGAYSRRINIKHRLVYEVLEDIGTVKVLRMWTHYE